MATSMILALISCALMKASCGKTVDDSALLQKPPRHDALFGQNTEKKDTATVDVMNVHDDEKEIQPRHDLTFVQTIEKKDNVTVIGQNTEKDNATVDVMKVYDDEKEIQPRHDATLVQTIEKKDNVTVKIKKIDHDEEEIHGSPAQQEINQSWGVAGIGYNNCGSKHFGGSTHRRRRWWSRRRWGCDCGDPRCCSPGSSVCPEQVPIWEGSGNNISLPVAPCSCDCAAPAGYELVERTERSQHHACSDQHKGKKYYLKFNFQEPFAIRKHVKGFDPCKCMCAKVHGQPRVFWTEENGARNELCAGECGIGCPGGAWKITCMAHDVCVVASMKGGHRAINGMDPFYCGGIRFTAEINAVGCSTVKNILKNFKMPSFSPSK